MKVIFFGTPDYVLPILEAVHKNFSFRGESPILAVVTQPPRPTGRDQRLTYSEVDSWAFKKKVPIFYEAKKVMDEDLGADLGILAAYGAIIPKEVIDSFPLGIINIHPSLLPKWRGASPIQATILSGEKETGVSIMKLDEKMDHGPIISQFKDEVLEDETTEALRNRLFERSAQVLVELLDPYLKGKIALKDQDHDDATFTTMIKKDDAFIPPAYLNAALEGKELKTEWQIPFIKDLSVAPSAETLHRFIKSMNPWPVAWTYIKVFSQAGKKRIKILKAHLEGTALILDEVQLEGKDPAPWKQFSKAYTDAAFVE